MVDDQAGLTAYALLLSAALARDLEAAGQLSEATRRTLHTGLGEVRDKLANGEHGLLKSALGLLDEIPTAADG